jgi:hypothetical protein
MGAGDKRGYNPEGLPMQIDHEFFISVWNQAASLTEASLMLQRAGHARMTPRRTLEWSRCLRAFGIPLKYMRRGKLPPLRDPTWLKVK